MPTALEEQILDVIETKLETIAGLTGGAERATAGPEPLRHAAADRPFIQIRHAGTSRRWHLRGAYECVMRVDLVLVTNQNDETIRNLVSDVVKTVDANARWNDGTSNLADRSWCAAGDVEEVEVNEGEIVAVVAVFVLFYEDVANPTLVKEI